MQFPIDEHSVCIRDCGPEIFTVDVVNSQNGSRDANEIYQVSEGREDRFLVFEIARFVFRERARTRDDLGVVSL